MEYKLIGYKEKDLFEFYDLKEYEAFKPMAMMPDGAEGLDLTENLVPVYIAVEEGEQ